MIRCLLLVCFCIGSSVLSAQKPLPHYPRGYFRWPVNLAPQIVANMGELRPNHWHMGLDVRTNQHVNQRVYAAADGYIAYVGIRPLSFGRFIMINHPNGLTTLYGHLNDFAPELEAYITEHQYKSESWATELTIPKNRFPVKKGDFIAFSGTTGGSQGPHVHFEIRDTKSGKCLNPLLFGLPLTDHVKPTMVRLALYDRSKSVFEQSPKLFLLRNTENGYIIPGMPVLKTNEQKLSLGLQAYDRISGSNNQDGIYSARLFLDDQLKAEFVIDSIDYNETRYVNANIDYKHHADGGIFIQHLSRLPGNNGTMYSSLDDDGIISFTDTSLHTVRIEAEDGYGNVSTLNFMLQYDESSFPGSGTNSSDLVFFPNNVNVLEKPDFEAYIPENCLYDFFHSSYYRRSSTLSGQVSAEHQLNDPSIPLHTNITIRIKPDKAIPANEKDKVVIRRSWHNSIDYEHAQWQGDWVSAQFNELGSFQAFVDITDPSINELGRGDTINLSASRRILFTPKDNSAIKSFRAELDGKWLRFTNDKGHSWIYIFDKRCPYGIHELKVTVEDIVGNSTTKIWWFKRYPYTPKKKTVRKRTTTKKKAPVRRKK